MEKSNEPSLTLVYNTIYYSYEETGGLINGIELWYCWIAKCR